jgi:hypothetical protein
MAGVRRRSGDVRVVAIAEATEHKCDNPPRKIPYYRLRPTTLAIKQ